jgi:hypothetical protein
MRPNWYRRTRPIEWIGVTVLCGSVKHVYQSWLGVRWSWLSCKYVHHPLHARGICAHICLPDDVFVARDAHPTVRTGAQDRQLALSIHFRDSRLSRHAVGTGQECPSNLGFNYLIRHVVSIHRLTLRKAIVQSFAAAAMRRPGQSLRCREPRPRPRPPRLRRTLDVISELDRSRLRCAVLPTVRSPEADTA